MISNPHHPANVTIAEMLAARARKAGAVLESSGAVPANGAGPGKPAARSLVLRAGTEPEETREPAAPEPPERRSLSRAKGEDVPLTPRNPSATDAAWHQAAQGLEGELCAVRHPEDPETAWLALRHPSNRHLPMLLLTPLPWVLYENPMPVEPTAEDEPY